MNTKKYRQAVETNLTRSSIWKLAESVAQQLKFRPCDDIIPVIKKLGGRVKAEDALSSDPEKSGSLYVNCKGDFTIILPLHTGSTRDRFTLAHELGHYIVHYLWPLENEGLDEGKMIALRKGSERVEWEANWFASAFLMPEQAFRHAHEEFNGRISELSKHFCVSSAAADVRVRSLGL